jgi:putative DNA primase/helicase
LDNLSGISPHLSDAICVLATGGGFGTRELFTDDEEKLFNAKRPVLINGIDRVAERSDLVDRGVNLSLPVIPEEQRQDEAELWQRFTKMKPSILGALLDALSGAIRNLPNVVMDRKPRMADFAKWSVAAETALGFKPGTFLAAYEGNQAEANSVAIESSIIGPLILNLMQDQELWQGTVKDLLELLEGSYATESAMKRKEWPKSARKLSSELKRLAPSLRKSGVNVTFGEHTRRGTPVSLENLGNRPSPSSPSSNPNSGNELGCEHSVTIGDDVNIEPSRPKPLGTNECELGDEGDELLQDGSGDEWGEI